MGKWMDGYLEKLELNRPPYDDKARLSSTRHPSFRAKKRNQEGSSAISPKYSMPMRRLPIQSSESSSGSAIPMPAV